MSATAFQRLRREVDAKKLAEANTKEFDLSKLKNDELKAMLDEKGIGYDAKATKAELIKLLEGAE